MRARLARNLAYLLWLIDFVRRNPTVRNLLIGHVLLFWVAPTVFFLWIGLASRLAFGLGFMVFQFVGLFYFLASGKTTTILPGDETQLTMKDFYGYDIVKKTMMEWVFLLQNPAKLKAMGGRAVRGILLDGKPGVGKSWLSRCIAGEINIPFVGTDGSSFTSMFMGIGVIKVIRLWAKFRSLARRYGACIGFIDEIDSLGARGGMAQGGMGMAGGMFGGGGMGTLNRILVEMDGMEEISRMMIAENKVRRFLRLAPISPRDFMVLIVGATNRPDALDEAMLRPGRFDKKIHFDAPDKASRRAIFNGYLGKVANSLSISDVEALVSITEGLVAGDISAAMQTDACRFAIFDDRDKINRADIERGLLEQQMGLENPISEWNETQRKSVAWHEAGHTVAQWHLLRDETVVATTTIVRRGRTLGFMLPRDLEGTYSWPFSRVEKEVVVLLAGFYAAKVGMDEPWVGAAGDGRGLLSILQSYYYNWGFGLPLGEFDKMGSAMKKKIDARVKEWQDRTEKFCMDHKNEIERIANALLEKSTLNADEIAALMEEKQ